MRSEGGFTLIELLLATGMMVVVLGTAVSVLTPILKDQPGVNGRDFNIQKARVALERLTREVRQGLAVDQATTSTLAIRTYTRRSVCGGTGTLSPGASATLCRVTYTCTGGTCTRTEAQPNGSGAGSAVKVVQGLSGNNVFSYSPNTTAPTYVGIRLALPNPSGTGSLTIGDGASLRNGTLEN